MMTWRPQSDGTAGQLFSSSMLYFKSAHDQFQMLLKVNSVQESFIDTFLQLELSNSSCGGHTKCLQWVWPHRIHPWCSLCSVYSLGGKRGIEKSIRAKMRIQCIVECSPWCNCLGCTKVESTYFWGFCKNLSLTADPYIQPSYKKRWSIIHTSLPHLWLK